MSSEVDRGDSDKSFIPNSSGSAKVRDEEYWNRRLTEHLVARRKRLEDARALVPGSVSYGASNFPHDPTVWLLDWRDNLPLDDPRRDEGPPITKSGTPEAYDKMAAAYRAISSAYGLTPDETPDEGADQAL